MKYFTLTKNSQCKWTQSWLDRSIVYHGTARVHRWHKTARWLTSMHVRGGHFKHCCLLAYFVTVTYTGLALCCNRNWYRHTLFSYDLICWFFQHTGMGVQWNSHVRSTNDSCRFWPEFFRTNIARSEKINYDFSHENRQAIRRSGTGYTESEIVVFVPYQFQLRFQAYSGTPLLCY